MKRPVQSWPNPSLVIGEIRFEMMTVWFGFQDPPLLIGLIAIFIAVLFVLYLFRELRR